VLHPWHDVALPENLEDPLPAIIEIGKGSKVKYELDKRSGLLMVDRILFSAVHYPANYGFVPRTFCDDGDPLDVLVFCQEPIHPLSVMRAKVIGVMKMRDEKGEDDKLVAVHADDPEYADFEDVSELPQHRMRELRQFFEDYKNLEHKMVVVSDPLGRDEAIDVLRDAVEMYARERSRLLGLYQPQPPPPPVPSGDRPPRKTRPARKAPAAKAVRPRGAPARRPGRR
jgi:inorganic pyrophosphatase